MDRMKVLPLPRADMDLYNSIMEAGFAAYPERLENYNRYKAVSRGIKLDYLPIKMDIENVSRCNFQCSMCQVSQWPDRTRGADMSIEDFKNLIDQQYGLVEIKIQGMGEPLLGKDDYIEMIRYARSRHIWVRSTVNGSLLSVDDNYKKIIDADVCELHVSIDGATERTYKNIRHGGSFKQVTRNAAMLNRYARDVGRLRTRMWTVGQRANFHEFEKFPDLAAELGFGRLSVSLDLNDWGQDLWRDQNDLNDIQNEFDFDLAQRMIDNGKRKGVEVTFWFLDKKFDTSAPEKLCPWPFERAYISSDMRAVPCCMIANPDVLELGDARDLTTVWNSKEMVTFRQAHIDGDLPSVCRTCYVEPKS